MSNENQETTSENGGAIVSDAGRKVTWHYERKVGLDNYGSEAVSIFVTDHVPENMSAVQVVMDRTQPAVDILKAEVWKALGLPFTWEGGHPVLEPGPPKQAASPPPIPGPSPGASPPVQGQAPAPPAPPAPAPQHQPRGDAPTVAQVGYYAEQPTFCKDCGHQEFYDNRGEVDQAIQNRERAGPDWRCKSCRGGSGKKGGIFRPGTYEYNNAIKAGQDPYAGPATAPPQS